MPFYVILYTLCFIHFLMAFYVMFYTLYSSRWPRVPQPRFRAPPLYSRQALTLQSILCTLGKPLTKLRLPCAATTMEYPRVDLCQTRARGLPTAAPPASLHRRPGRPSTVRGSSRRAHTFNYTMLYYAILCYTMLCYAILCYAMLCYAMLCYAMLCYTMLYYAILCYTMLWLMVTVRSR